MKINFQFFRLIVFSLFIFFAREISAAQKKDEQKEAEQLQSQYEKYILGCMHQTINAREALQASLETLLAEKNKFLPCLSTARNGSYDLLTSDNEWLDIYFQNKLVSDGVKRVLGVEKKEKFTPGAGHQKQIRIIFEKMIDDVNEQIPEQETQDGIQRIDKKAKLAEFDGIFINADPLIIESAKKICDIFDELSLKRADLEKKIKASQQDVNKKYINSLFLLFQHQLSSSKKMVLLEECNLKLNKILGILPAGGFGEVRTIDGMLDDLEALFSQKMYDQLSAEKDTIIDEIDAIEKSFDELFGRQLGVVTKESKKALLKKYKEMYKTASVSADAQKKIQDIIIMLETDLNRDPLDPLAVPELDTERIAECEWYLQEIPKFKQWIDTWYASGPIVVPLGLFATFFSYFAYKGYRSHQDKYINQLKDKISFLDISKKERDALLARLDDFLIKYVPFKVLCFIDSAAELLDIESKQLTRFDKKVMKLYEECLDKKEAGLYAVR